MKVRASSYQTVVPGRKKYVKIVFLSATVLLFLAVRPLSADIYSYIDSQGVLHFTNVPTSAKYKVYIKEKPSRSLNLYTSNQYDHMITGASQRHGVSFSLLKALIKTESDFDHRAISNAGAKGLMQIMPENIRLLRIKDPFDPWENIMGGARYLKQLIERFNGELSLALAAYNAGPNIVERHQGIPPIKETEDFVKKVLGYYSMYEKR
ncbi:MAG: lytic transglycosylase domain-containing protein [Proteobacteria bacterium]|nr:lytic transglycosylase domain-containing protein [Pseudomonadota bacterium]